MTESGDGALEVKWCTKAFPTIFQDTLTSSQEQNYCKEQQTAHGGLGMMVQDGTFGCGQNNSENL